MGLTAANVQQNYFVYKLCIELPYKSPKKKKKDSLGFISLNLREKLRFLVTLVLNKTIQSRCNNKEIITTSFLRKQSENQQVSPKD